MNKLSGSVSYQIVNAFTDGGLFTGNPAGVCPLESWLDDAVMQSIAEQNNLAETSFLIPDGASKWKLRWFTPACEVKLCGHATLAAAHSLFDLGQSDDVCSFETLSGLLTVEKGEGSQLWMDFPAKPVKSLPLEDRIRSLFPEMVHLGKNDLDYYVIEVPTAEAVRSYEPDFNQLLVHKDIVGYVLTAAADPDAEEDFISRFFAPNAGVPEDPVTGSAHCSLFPYWAERLGKTELVARQVSPRGGRVVGRIEAGGRVRLGGSAKTFAQGELRFS